MRLRLVAAGTKVPGWVDEAYADYSGRFGPELRLELREIPIEPRGRGGDVARLRAREGERMQSAIERTDYVVALVIGGRSLSTEALAKWLAERQQDGRDVVLLIGGPDGLAPECIARADLQWSLSPLTFPHALVRILVAEQLYRALSILRNHPYHRGAP